MYCLTINQNIVKHLDEFYKRHKDFLLTYYIEELHLILPF
nr:MAG TPA: hypothetical protein [Caudoviricetes sp.]